MRNDELKRLVAALLFRRASKLLGCTLFMLFIPVNGMIYASGLEKVTAAEAVMQQKRIPVKGVIVDEQNLPVIGANITEKGTANGSISDINGEFTLSVAPGATLQISYIGFMEKNVAVKDKTDFRIVLLEDSKALDEIVVIGYGVARKQDLTSAISSIKGEELERYSTGNVLSAMQGQIAGVQVVNSSGVPGKNPAVTIRGISTFGNNSPLYVVNGTPMGNDISYLNPNDIESMEVLKDASASAIYGTRASSGVILVTTKKGKAGKTIFQFDASVGLQTIASPGMADGIEYANVLNEKARNDNGPDAALPFPDMNSVTQGTNWWKEVMNSVAPEQKYNLSFSGGSDKIIYSASLGYYRQDSQMDKGYWEKISSRFNLEFNFNKYVNYSQELNINYEGLEDTPGAVSNILKMDPTTPVFLPEEERINDGTNDRSKPLNWYHRSNNNQAFNPVGMVARGGNDAYSGYRFISNSSLEIKPLKGLTLRSQLGLMFKFDEKDIFTPTFFIDNLERNEVSSIDRRHNNNFNWSWNNILTYEKKISNHQFNIIGGMTMEKYRSRTLRGQREKLPSEIQSLQQIDAATGDMTMAGNMSTNTLLSYLARLNYNYDNRYYLTATGRYDGSSKFMDNNKWAFFPSLSLAWRVTGEDFLKDSEIISNLKVRLGWGKIGNQNIDNGVYIDRLDGSYYPFGLDKELQLTYLPNSVKNPDIKWETVEDTNIGIDLSLFRDKLSFTADYYVRKTHDMLMEAKNPLYGGYPTSFGKIWTNVGSIQVKGWELSATYTDKFNNLGVRAGLTASHASNKALALANGEAMFDGSFDGGGFITKTVEGGKIGEYYGYIIDGIFQNQKEIDGYLSDKGELIQKNALPGDFKYRDWNKDGTIDDKDRTVIGNPYPDINLGLNIGLEYKNFDLSTSFYASLGGDNFNHTKFLGTTAKNNMNVFKGVYQSVWREGNEQNATMPRLSSTDLNGNFSKVSTYFVEDASFLRCRDLQVGYTIPKSFCGIHKLRVYASVQNLFVITGYSGQDPEVGGGTLTAGIDKGLYPQPRTYVLGLKMSF